MQHVVFEVLEAVVGGFRAFEIRRMMLEEQVPPAVGVVATDMPESVHRELVMGAGTAADKDDVEHHRHGHTPSTTNGRGTTPHRFPSAESLRRLRVLTDPGKLGKDRFFAHWGGER